MTIAAITVTKIEYEDALIAIAYKNIKTNTAMLMVLVLAILNSPVYSDARSAGTWDTAASATHTYGRST